MTEEKSDNLRDLVAEVAAAYFANTHVAVTEIGAVIEQITKSLGAVGRTSPSATPAEDEAPAPATRKLTPAQIRRSIAPQVLTSFEDGKPYKTLRRHLAAHGLTPEQYREKWGLPNDYPMVSANYSAARSQMAKDLGLGNRRADPVPAAAPAPSTRRRRAPKAAE